MVSTEFPSLGSGPYPHLACLKFCWPSVGGDSQDKAYTDPSKPASITHPHFPSKKTKYAQT